MQLPKFIAVARKEAEEENPYMAGEAVCDSSVLYETDMVSVAHRFKLGKLAEGERLVVFKPVLVIHNDGEVEYVGKEESADETRQGADGDYSRDCC